MDKNELDLILEKYKAEPVGWGYIDIIVMRDNVKNFVREVITQDIHIDGISWWAYYPRLDIKLGVGMGGPISKFYSGWFSEIGIHATFDERQKFLLTKQEEEKDIMNIVENKIIKMGNKKFSYKEHEFLTPAFWLDVPDDWRNIVGD